MLDIMVLPPRKVITKATITATKSEKPITESVDITLATYKEIIYPA